MNFILLTAILLIVECNCMHQPKKEAGSQNIDSSKSPGGKQIEMNINTDYDPIPLDKLIGVADLIVMGNVVRLSDSTFTLQIANLIAGNYDFPEIEIKQFHPNKFEGAPRAIAYKAGQSYLLFLKHYDKSAGPAKQWLIMGIGGEGEMPYADNYIYFPGRNVEIVNYGEFIVFGNKIRIQRYPLELFISSVKEYRKCFKWNIAEITSKTEIYLPSLICNKSALDNYTKVSTIHKYLVDLSLRKISR